METIEITKDNKIRSIPCKKWYFIWNNYEEDDIKWLINEFGNNENNYIFSKEIGEFGIEYLQGYVEFNKKCRPLECIKTKKIHWEKARSSKKYNELWITRNKNEEEYELFSNYYEEIEIIKHKKEKKNKKM